MHLCESEETQSCCHYLWNKTNKQKYFEHRVSGKWLLYGELGKEAAVDKLGFETGSWCHTRPIYMDQYQEPLSKSPNSPSRLPRVTQFSAAAFDHVLTGWLQKQGGSLHILFRIISHFNSSCRERSDSRMEAALVFPSRWDVILLQKPRHRYKQ